MRHLINATSAFTTSVDRISLPIQETTSISISLLANDIAQWITGSRPGLAVSKLNLLCSPVFRNLFKDCLDDELIQTFRLLVWATTLLDSTTSQPDNSVHIQAQKSLVMLVEFYGNAVMLEVDRLCKYSNMKSHSPQQRMLLFLVLIGLCLAASYIRPCEGISEVNHHHSKNKYVLRHLLLRRRLKDLASG